MGVFIQRAATKHYPLIDGLNHFYNFFYKRISKNVRCNCSTVEATFLFRATNNPKDDPFSFIQDKRHTANRHI